MSKEKEYGTKQRLLRILFAIVENPKGYTKKRLADLYADGKESTIKHDFQAFKNAGLQLDFEKKNYCYYFKEEQKYKQLKDLLHFSEEDQAMINLIIDRIDTNGKRGQRLKKKLASLYDYKRLGHAYLRKPYLTRVDLLLQAKADRQQVILRDYRSSNKNKISDRLVEGFHVSPPDDTLQAYCVHSKGLRHFRISRISRVQLTRTPWAFEGHHTIMRTDPFRIVQNQQVMVHLRLKVGAYNELIERFPLTKSYITESEEEDIFDFQCMVNYKFLGLTNFILGYYHQLVEVLEPDSLLDHLRDTVEKMDF